MADEKIIIDLQVDTDKMQKNLSLAMSKVASLKESQKALRKEIEAGNDKTGELAATYAEYGKQLEQAQREIKSNTAALQLSTAAMVDENSSLDEQRQLLNAAQKAYAQLSGEAKKAADAEGGLADQIKHLSDVVKEQEMSVGDARRNVGNYAESVQDAFGGIAKSAGDLAPAVSILRNMGGEGKKLGDALDMVGKVMQLVGKAGQQVATAMKAQTVATNAQTTAQGTLNAVMAANPIGLIIAGISTLIPLIQAFCSATKDAEQAQKTFNDEQERYDKILEERQYELNYEIEMMKLEGATATDIAKKRKEAAWDEYNTAKDLRLKKEAELQAAQDKGNKRLSEELEAQVAELKKNEEERLKLYRRAGDALTLETLKAQKKANDDSQKLRDDASNKRKQERAQQAAEDRKFAIDQFDTIRLIAEAEAATALAQFADLQEQAHALLNTINESEEEENIPTPDEMARNMFGLDAEGVEYFRELLDKGVSFAEAKTRTLEDQTLRMTKSFATSFGNLGDAFSDMADMLGEFAEENEDAAKAQKAFALMGILLNQAQSISNGALAIAEGVASAASIPFPGNIPAIISIVAQITALMAGVGSSIAQAKQLFSQADRQKFAQGGIVGGSSYSGDHVPVMANSGEMYLNRESQQELFEVLKSPTGKGLGIDYDMMAAAMANVPAPVVVYKELEQFGDRVATYNEIASV